jgi:hypothetical protein
MRYSLMSSVEQNDIQKMEVDTEYEPEMYYPGILSYKEITAERMFLSGVTTRLSNYWNLSSTSIGVLLSWSNELT